MPLRRRRSDQPSSWPEGLCMWGKQEGREKRTERLMMSVGVCIFVLAFTAAQQVYTITEYIHIYLCCTSIPRLCMYVCNYV